MKFRKEWMAFLYVMLLSKAIEIAYTTPQLNKFPLKKRNLDKTQFYLYYLMSSLPLSANTIENIVGIPKGLTDVKFISLEVSHAADSLVTGLRAKKANGEEVFYFDTNNDEDFSNEVPLKMDQVNNEFYRVKVDLPSQVLELVETDQQPVDVGYHAPMFEGKIWGSHRHFKLSEQRGIVTVLFFSHPDCGGTRTCMPSLKEMKNDLLGQKTINFISISRDSSEVLGYQRKFDFQFESIINDRIWKQYGVIVTPTIFIIDDKGVICHRKSGAAEDEGKLLRDMIEKLLKR